MFFTSYAIGLFILFVSSIKASKNVDISNVCSKLQTTTINGLFILIVLMSHLISYTKEFPFTDRIVVRLVGMLGQYMVATFLFFSGYGVCTSIISTGGGYTKVMPIKRVLVTYINFDIAVLIYILLMIFTPMQFHSGIGISLSSATDVVLSFVGLKSAGNSNWYIVAMIYMYIATYFSFRWTGVRKLSFALVFIFTSIYFLSFYFAGFGTWWFDTIFCYFAGMFYAFNKESIYSFYKKHWWLYFIVNMLLCMAITLLNLKNMLPAKPLVTNVGAVLFVNVFVIFMHRFEFRNKILLFFGSNLFGIYIMQRIPMRYLQPFLGNYYIYNAVCVVLAVLVGVVFQKILAIVDEPIRKIALLRSEQSD